MKLTRQFNSNAVAVLLLRMEMPLHFHIYILRTKNICKPVQQISGACFSCFFQNVGQRPIFIAGKADQPFGKLFQF